MPSADVVERIGAAHLLPVLRVPDAAAAVRAASQCFAAGLDVVELTATTDDWVGALTDLRSAEPGRMIGLGSVLDTGTARRALDLGADFIVSPCPVPAVRSVVGSSLFIEGGWSVAEILDAGRRGPVKLFPAHVGGVAYLRTVLALDPKLRIIPTGGIGLADVRSWLDAGAFAVGVGTALLSHDGVAAAVAAALGRPDAPTL